MTQRKARGSSGKERTASAAESGAQSANAELSAEALDRERLQLRRLTLIIPVGTALLATTAGLLADLGTAILVVAFGVLVAAITIFWASLRTLSGDVPPSLEDALALSHPTAAEEQKRAVLQALRDLEYERSVGKISEPDYAALRDRYRAEAKRLLKALDEGMDPLRKQAEAFLARELENSARPRASRDEAWLRCPDCGTARDRDAVFCKKCGTRFSHAVEKPEDATA